MIETSIILDEIWFTMDELWFIVDKTRKGGLWGLEAC